MNKRTRLTPRREGKERILRNDEKPSRKIKHIQENIFRANKKKVHDERDQVRILCKLEKNPKTRAGGENCLTPMTNWSRRINPLRKEKKGIVPKMNQKKCRQQKGNRPGAVRGSCPLIPKWNQDPSTREEKKGPFEVTSKQKGESGEGGGRGEQAARGFSSFAATTIIFRKPSGDKEKKL